MAKRTWGQRQITGLFANLKSTVQRDGDDSDDEHDGEQVLHGDETVSGSVRMILIGPHDPSDDPFPVRTGSLDALDHRDDTAPATASTTTTRLSSTYRTWDTVPVLVPRSQSYHLCH